MSSRNYPNWLEAFMEYTAHTEAPAHMRFWSGVSTIAGALQRKAWIDEGYFQWYPNLYIVLVAPPGVVSKSTTAGLGMSLLRKVEGVRFGPEVTTWQALYEAFEKAKEEVPIPYDSDMFYPQSALTIESSELGTFLDVEDTAMLDTLVSMWDGKQGKMEKTTKTSGSNVIENPWINLIACTTPSWLSNAFSEYMIGGGFVSRTIFVYADKKAQLIAYPSQHIPADFKERQLKLTEDLQHIFERVRGVYKLSAGARTWGTEWYARHDAQLNSDADAERFRSMMARKQTMLHKVAMILAAAESDELVITADHLQMAHMMLSDLEPDLQFVFSKIGQSLKSTHAERLIQFVHAKKSIGYVEAYRFVHSFFSSMRDYEDVLMGCIRAGYIHLQGSGDRAILTAGSPLPKATNGRR